MKVLNILLIEDDTIEVMKFNRVVASLSQQHCIKAVTNGEEAMLYLEQSEKLPDIILLDLNMPKLNGIELLGLLKENKRLECIPAIVLTTSSNPTDISSCSSIGAAGYVIKPLKYEDYVDRIKSILGYWCVNELNCIG